MKKILFILFILFSGTSFSQQQIDYLDKTIEDFENSTNWIVESANYDNISDKVIIITAAFKLGCSSDLSSEHPEQQYVLGIKVEQSKISEYEIIVRPEEPIYLGNWVQLISYWTQGDNYNHYVKMVLLDKDMVPIPDWVWSSSQRLNFSGWKQITYAISSYLQMKELYFNGFEIYINPLASIADNYFYFDFINMVIGTIE